MGCKFLTLYLTFPGVTKLFLDWLTNTFLKVSRFKFYFDQSYFIWWFWTFKDTHNVLLRIIHFKVLPTIAILFLHVQNEYFYFEVSLFAYISRKWLILHAIFSLALTRGVLPSLRGYHRKPLTKGSRNNEITQVLS